jgi:hypothetical protein
MVNQETKQHKGFKCTCKFGEKRTMSIWSGDDIFYSLGKTWFHHDLNLLGEEGYLKMKRRTKLKQNISTPSVQKSVTFIEQSFNNDI